ncbi:threonine-phosphate decarboxylase [compost metagenome]
MQRFGLDPQGGCALFQWLVTDKAVHLHDFMAHRGILLRLFTHTSSLRFGLPAEDADWQRLEQAFIDYLKETP